MNILIIGAGRMGIRHAQGISTIDMIKNITLVDINQSALDNAKALLQNTPNTKFEFSLLEAVNTEGSSFEIGILASTANNRIELYNLLVKLGCKHILAEKPLGQSYNEVVAFNDAVSKVGTNCFVNLNMRLYDCFIQLRSDLKTLPQLQGVKTITLNTGSLGIGANGIHYLDLLYFILDADNSEIVAAEIDETIIPSGRGANFCDFGGWSVINFYKEEKLVGKVLLSMSSTSTVFGSWDIVAPHGRIYLNEVEQKRIDTFRKADSTMPINRYFADYLAPVETTFNSLALGDLTAIWLKHLIKNGESLLPTVDESIKVHALMFDWLSYSKTHKTHFPIT
jgi:predicted dehydrogenase